MQATMTWIKNMFFEHWPGSTVMDFCYFVSGTNLSVLRLLYTIVYRARYFEFPSKFRNNNKVSEANICFMTKLRLMVSNGNQSF